jgi:uncharacterized protein (DUF362 family)
MQMTPENKQNTNASFDRRRFLTQAIKAGASIAAASTLAAGLYDIKGPGRSVGAEQLVTLPQFSVPPIPGKTMSIINGPDRVVSVQKAIELLGGIERFVKPGQHVVIKPNIAFASPPILSATTHPQLVAEVARLCYKAGAKKVSIVDNPINDPSSCFTLSGIGRAALDAGAEVVLPKDTFFRPTTLTGGTLIKDWPVLFEPVSKADCLIGISPVKNHHRSGASMSMKNWYGLLGGRRNIFHQDINTIISELSQLVKPTLVILDGVNVMMTNGPTGGSVSDLRQANTLIASCDMVAADTFGASLLDMKPSDLPYLALAEKAGVGTMDYQSLKPLSGSLG